MKNVLVHSRFRYRRKNRYVSLAIGLNFEVQQAKHIFTIVKPKFPNGKNQKVGPQTRKSSQIDIGLLFCLSTKTFCFFSPSSSSRSKKGKEKKQQQNLTVFIRSFGI